MVDVRMFFDAFILSPKGKPARGGTAHEQIVTDDALVIRDGRQT